MISLRRYYMYIKTDYEITEWDMVSALGKKFIKKCKRKIYILKCNQCKEEFIQRTWYPKGRLNNSVKHFCKKCSDPALFADLGRETARKNRIKKIGERIVDSQGYVSIYVGDTHPYSEGWCGRMREHILVVENHLKRSLYAGADKNRRTGLAEVVHHVDGNKQNNDLSNLQLMTVTEHNACHGASGTLILDMYRQGVLGYNWERKRYFMKNPKCLITSAVAKYRPIDSPAGKAFDDNLNTDCTKLVGLKSVRCYECNNTIEVKFKKGDTLVDHGIIKYGDKIRLKECSGCGSSFHV